MKCKFLLLLPFISLSTFAEIGKASYYTEESCKREGTSGIWTASGKRFNENEFTCAMRRRDWGAKFKVTNLDNGKSVIVTLTDFGPGKKATANGVIIDLTPKAFIALGVPLKQGIIYNVKVEKCSK